MAEEAAKGAVERIKTPGTDVAGLFAGELSVILTDAAAVERVALELAQVTTWQGFQCFADQCCCVGHTSSPFHSALPQRGYRIVRPLAMFAGRHGDACRNGPGRRQDCR